ncbi:signal transduction histidine kinase/ligand-binding sensor domain-containing protein/DNA-binding response OmpR family regulator [Algoriphagus sp. 4150]|uniref:hybrid sensor histidine kinase/response regulator transcription factor n=1 Tax=Algoriphagus sp. 4150 TaxID=2817756 RepID=UPI00285A83A7|nr:two-component regulator propeller domain-containing protein [Algoriphagus sp. 4150]MDR7130219.1 signal transduction histidine kinase/ligand-binding sensor domain-containing protein/DNA-binding response OmpR family regulator [Algoriphagus sp. 4150]
MNPYRLFVLAIVLVCCLHLDIQAQIIQSKFTHLDVNDGLSQGSVYAICQDYTGLIWIGTRDGLNKYDARKFTVYRNLQGDSTSLSDNYVISMLEDSKHRLWVGTYYGLNVFDRDKDQFERIALKDFKGVVLHSQPIIYSIFEDGSGTLWISTGKGVFRIDEGKNDAELVFHSTLFPNDSIPSNLVQFVYRDSEELLWICTEAGLYVMQEDDDQGKLTFRHAFFGGGDGQALNDQNTTIVEEVSEGILWIGTKKGGINSYDKSTGKFSYITHDPKNPNGLLNNEIRSIFKDVRGGYWIGTFGGLNYYSKEGLWQRFVSDQKNPYSLSHNSVRPVFQDRKGAVWVGTFFGGVSVLDSDIPRFDNYTHSPYVPSLSHHVISRILLASEDGNELWIGTEGGGLNYLDRKKNTFKYYAYEENNPASLSHDNVKSLYLDKSDNLWIGTYLGGINLLRKGTESFIRIAHEPGRSSSLSHNSVYAIAEDEEGNFWFGTYGGGLNFMARDSENHFERYSPSSSGKYFISSEWIRSLDFDSKGNLWVGSEEGLNVLWKGAEEFQTFRFSLENPKSISGNVIISVFEDSKGRIWIGTYKNGLNLYHPEDGSFSGYGVEDGLPGNNIFGIAEDGKGDLWLSTNYGISRFSPDSGTTRNFNIEDGISGNEFVMGSYCMLNTGEIAFGGFQGLTVFHPDSLRSNTYVPPVILTDFKLFNKSVPPGDGRILSNHIAETEELVLRHNQNVFSVEFSALNYLLPSKNRYAYKLTGFEEDWNYVDNPVASYTNLNAGSYTLMVKGSNNDGLWNEVPRLLSIKVLPPLWKTWWAFLIYGLLMVSGVLLLVRFTKIRSKLEQNLYIEQLEKERQKEMNEIKLNFFTNISHEFRTPLTLILTPLDRILADMDLNRESKTMLESIRQSGFRLLRLVNQLLDFRKQETGNMEIRATREDLVGFLKEVFLTFRYYANEKKINLTFESEEEAIQVYFDRDMIEKVIVNLLSNSIKYTEQGGKVCLKVGKSKPNTGFPEGSAFFTVEDNGRGIPSQDLETVFDCFYQVSDKFSRSRGRENSSGIGLALAKGLVKEHKGTIEVESNNQEDKEKRYTRFTVTIPLGNRHLKSDQIDVEEYDVLRDIRTLDGELLGHLHYDILNLSAVSETGQDTKTRQENKPLLVIVEDNEEVRALVGESLSDIYQVVVAADGLEGWERIQRYIPDLIISDVMMPHSDGLELLSKVKKDIRTNHIPVILLTARSSADYLVLGLSQGSDDYITKPFSLNVLKLKIENLLSGRENLRKKFIREYLLHPKEEQPSMECPEKEFLKKGISIVEANLGEEKLSVSLLVTELGVSRPVLYRKIKQLTGLNVIELINHIRLRKAAQFLVSGQWTISEVAYKTGFNDPKYFGKTFKAQFGKSPSEYIAENGNQDLLGPSKEKLTIDDIG